MFKKHIVFAVCLGLSSNAFASSLDAWDAFKAKVTSACEKAAPHLRDLRDYHITVDPHGSESYGMAVIRGTSESSEDAVMCVCVYDKKTGKAEIGSEIKDPPVSRSQSLHETPSSAQATLDDTKGLNGIDASVR